MSPAIPCGRPFARPRFTQIGLIPNVKRYERSVDDFIAAILSEEYVSARRSSMTFARFQQRVAHFGFAELACRKRPCDFSGYPECRIRIRGPSFGISVWSILIIAGPSTTTTASRGCCKRVQVRASKKRGKIESAHRARDHRPLGGRTLQTLHHLARVDGCRREYPGLFTVGRYIPLRFAGVQARSRLRLPATSSMGSGH